MVYGRVYRKGHVHFIDIYSINFILYFQIIDINDKNPLYFGMVCERSIQWLKQNYGYGVI